MSRRAKAPRVNHQAAVAALRNKPGVWQPIGDYRNRITADNTASAIRYGRPLGSVTCTPYTPAGAFEARTELVEDVTRIHARYIGEEVAS